MGFFIQKKCFGTFSLINPKYWNFTEDFPTFKYYNRNIGIFGYNIYIQVLIATRLRDRCRLASKGKQQREQNTKQDAKNTKKV